MTNSAIKDAIRELALAKQALNIVVKETYPVGADVDWDKHGHRQYGRVKNHGGTGRPGGLRVENSHTGKTYWISMYDVLGYVPTPDIE